MQDCRGRACRRDENVAERIGDESQGVKGELPQPNFVVAINSRLIFATISTYAIVEDCSIVFKRGKLRDRKLKHGRHECLYRL